MNIVTNVFNAFEHGIMFDIKSMNLSTKSVDIMIDNESDESKRDNLSLMDQLAVKFDWYRNIGNYIKATKHLRNKNELIKESKQVIFDEIKIMNDEKECDFYPNECVLTLPENLLAISKLSLVSRCCDQESWITDRICNNYLAVQIIRNGVIIGQIVMIKVNSVKHRGIYKWRGKKTAMKNDIELNSIKPNDMLRVRVYSYSKDGCLLRLKSIKLSVQYYVVHR